jgi:integrase
MTARRSDLVTRKTTAKIYYGKAFENMRRALKEARKKSHPYASQVEMLKSPLTGEKEEVMALEASVRWCIKFHLPTWSPSTWRIVRCGYALLLERAGKMNALPEPKIKELLDLMQGVRGIPKSERVKKTSSRRKKILQEKHITQIESYIDKTQPKWGAALGAWLRASIITGLRPNEWQTAELKHEDGRVILKSENFKHNESRSYAPYREIDLTKLPDGSAEAVEQHLRIVNAMKQEGMYDLYYRGCSDLLRSINAKLWPRRKANITLYTGRHQFSANAKSEPGCSDAERAAMMGHKTTKTSAERYGKGRHGSNGLTPNIADPSVLNKIATPEPRVAPQQQKKPGVTVSREND